MLEIHAGDFHQVRWTDGPIEILMVDIAKSQSLWAHLVEEMFPSLVPGKSVVIQQDYYHTIQPEILVGMEFLSPYFEMPIPRVDFSAVFFCREAIPPDAIARLVSDDFTPEERLSLIDKAIARLAPEDRYNALLARCLKIDTNKDLETLLREIEEIDGFFPASTRADAHWRERLKQNIKINHGWNLVQAGEWAKALKVADQVLSRPGNEVVLLMRGCALNGLSRYAEAEESLRKFTPTGTEADQYVPVELARAVLHRGRYDEAEQILLESLSRDSAHIFVMLALMQHVTLLRDVLAMRGDGEKARNTIEILKDLMLEEPALAVFAEFEKCSAAPPCK
jgi:tetratricopeptide (TPR) repeat protein